MKRLPPIERLRELLEYNPKTGVIRWKVYRSRSAKAGDEAGSVSKNTGYRLIGIDGKNYTAGRIAWALHYGADPYPVEVDHKNLIRSDNAIGNLRLATRAEQLDNRGYKGERPIRITYPDGSMRVTRSIAEAATLLGRHRRTIQSILAHPTDNTLRVSQGPKPGISSGIALCYEV